ncbi:hypothetical protein ACWGII_18470 [Streptomyces sp. NPDC054855]
MTPWPGFEDLAGLVLLEPGVDVAEPLSIVDVGALNAPFLRVAVLCGLLIAHFVPAARLVAEAAHPTNGRREMGGR